MPLRIVIALACLMFVGSLSNRCDAAAQGGTTTPSLTGAYTCSGEQDGRPYTLALVVEPQGETYALAWAASPHEARHQPSIMGLGVLQGDRLAVAMVTSRGGIGVAIYTVAAGRLDAHWSPGDGTVSTEACRASQPA
jgi:hypothetical protein